MLDFIIVYRVILSREFAPTIIPLCCRNVSMAICLRAKFTHDQNEFVLMERVEFRGCRAAEVFDTIPAAPAVFLLRGGDLSSEPYVTKTANLKRRLQRLLTVPTERTKRLNLRDHVRWIEYSQTGSDFESGFLPVSALAPHFS